MAICGKIHKRAGKGCKVCKKIYNDHVKEEKEYYKKLFGITDLRKSKSKKEGKGIINPICKNGHKKDKPYCLICKAAAMRRYHQQPRIKALKYERRKKWQKKYPDRYKLQQERKVKAKQIERWGDFRDVALVLEQLTKQIRKDKHEDIKL